MLSIASPAASARPTPSLATPGRATPARARGSGRGFLATALRARCGGGGTEPVVARKDGGGGPGQKEGAEEAAAEELEVLEEEAMGGGDEGRRPTDYDRRAHIFEESSRVFSALKHRHDGGGGHGVEGDPAAAAAETARDVSTGS